MTIGHCNTCNNRGYIVKIKTPAIDRLAYLTKAPIAALNYERIEEYCKCSNGYQLQILDNQMSHPEYENPLAKMNDEELLAYLNHSSQELAAIDAEFNI
jgi:restriction endonuclease S subunit